MGDWTTAGGLPDGSVGNMSGIWNPQDFAQTMNRRRQVAEQVLVTDQAPDLFINTGRI